MDRISIGQAVSAGFRLIGRDPVAFAAWCAAYFVVGSLPTLLAWPEVANLYKALGSGGELTSPAVLAAQQRTAIYQPISMITGLIVLVCLPAAVLRAVIFPDDRRFLYLRLSAREFWFGIVTIVLFVGWMIAAFVLLIPVMLVAGIGAALGGSGGVVGAVVMLLLMPVAFGVGAWGALRLSLGPTMSFAERTFRLMESWTLTRGHAWRLFLVSLSLFAMIVLVELVLLVGVLLVVAAVTGGIELSDPTALFGLMSRVTLPAMLAVSAVFSVVIVAIYVIGTATWADIYRQLRPPVASTFD
jgi:hypothetical protein